MSWASLSSNQGVTYNNLQDAVDNGIFILNSSLPSSDRLITKSVASSYITNLNLSISSFADKSSNQIVTKADLVTASIVNVSVYGKKNRNDGATWKLFYAVDDPTMNSTSNMSMSSGSLTTGGSLLANISVYQGHTLYFKVANLYYQYSPATTTQIGSYPTSGSSLNNQYSYSIVSSFIPGSIYIYANIDNTLLFGNTPLYF